VRTYRFAIFRAGKLRRTGRAYTVEDLTMLVADDLHRLGCALRGVSRCVLTLERDMRLVENGRVFPIRRRELWADNGTMVVVTWDG
jgi:hypothetical protein